MSSPESSPFPPLTPSDILCFQFSSWYPVFSSLSIKSTVRPLPPDFVDYLRDDAHGVFLPEGSDDLPAESTLSDDEGEGEGEDSDGSDDGEVRRRFAFPELDAQIRECIQTYGAVFPKLNFSSPKDASWMLPQSSPCKCTSPADVYMLLKSSDFITHDLTAESVFTGCSSEPEPYALELVLRKWYPVDRSRELRCFVRQNALIGLSQRDTNYYDFLNDAPTKAGIVSRVRDFWETNIKIKWQGPQDYTFDLLLTRDLSRGHILDFNPYAPRTDPLLFSYDELHALSTSAAPELRVIDSRAHPAAISSAPANQHNMIPFEALSLSNGRDIEEFAEAWKEGIVQSVVEEEI
ncbi:D123-domain-containing protein [Mycena albidolilacea]|uniref:D123-domain-containing protein n=1 Tax=Mycena albidolilacea TaxID=1033008 RepID=A0AAD7F2X3_9AGAR|nr:D123-domain-containing protein [Mycena albidolilacea]